jgi:hypothetical protein
MQIVFQKIGGVLSKNKKGLKGHLSCLRFRGLFGVGAKPTRKTKNVHEKKREGNYTDLE